MDMSVTLVLIMMLLQLMIYLFSCLFVCKINVIPVKCYNVASGRKQSKPTENRNNDKDANQTLGNIV